MSLYKRGGALVVVTSIFTAYATASLSKPKTSVKLKSANASSARNSAFAATNRLSSTRKCRLPSLLPSFLVARAHSHTTKSRSEISCPISGRPRFRILGGFRLTYTANTAKLKTAWSMPLSTVTFKPSVTFCSFGRCRNTAREPHEPCADGSRTAQAQTGSIYRGRTKTAFRHTWLSPSSNHHRSSGHRATAVEN